jgi:hypothetical protein
MTATCTITRPASGTGPYYNQATGSSTYPTPTDVFTGACRVQRADVTSAGGGQSIGEKQTALRRYVVSLPLDADPVQVNDLVDVDTATDTSLVDTRLRVIGTRTGSLLWQQDLICEVHEATTR